MSPQVALLFHLNRSVGQHIEGDFVILDRFLAGAFDDLLAVFGYVHTELCFHFAERFISVEEFVARRNRFLNQVVADALERIVLGDHGFGLFVLFADGFDVDRGRSQAFDFFEIEFPSQPACFIQVGDVAFAGTGEREGLRETVAGLVYHFDE